MARCFKFRTGDRNDLDAFFDDYVWFAPLSTLNDPYEGGMYHDTTGIDEDLRLKFWKNIFDKTPPSDLSWEDALARGHAHAKSIGKSFSDFVDRYAITMLRRILKDYINRANVFSFSLGSGAEDFPPPLIDMLMWAHYANGFKGYCIEYDFDMLKNSIATLNEVTLSYSKIKYATDGKLPIVKLKTFMEDQIKNIDEFAIEALKALYVKEKNWISENEGRIITNKTGKMKIDPQCINAIYVSEKMPNGIKSSLLESAIKKDIGIKKFEILLHSSKYALGIKSVI